MNASEFTANFYFLSILFVLTFYILLMFDKSCAVLYLCIVENKVTFATKKDYVLSSHLFAFSGRTLALFPRLADMSPFYQCIPASTAY